MPHSAIVIKKGNPPVPLFDQSCSINYGGSNSNTISGGSNRTWGMANEFSVMYWFMPTAFTGSDNLLLVGAAGNAANLIFLQRQQSLTKWSGQLYSSGGSLFKSYHWDDGAGEIEEFQWYQLWLTWDGTDFDVYTNGVNRTASATKNTDNAGTMTNTARAFNLGVNLPGSPFPLDGNTHQVAFFDKKLTDAEILTTYNDGNGTAFNLAYNQGDYESKANLLDWYQMAKDTSSPQSSYYYDFGNVNDFDLNGINGTHTKETASPTGQLVENQTMITGVGDYLQSAEAVTGLGTDWTISTWIRRTSAGGAGQEVFQLSNSSLVANRRALFVNGTNELQIELRGPSGSSSASLVKSWAIIDLESAGSSVQWDHFVFTYTDGGGGDDALRVYVNGEDISFKTSAGSGPGDPYISKVNDGQPNQTDTAQNITLGSGTDGTGTSEWNGRMYNWAAWDSVLTAAEVTSIYNGGDGSLVDYRFSTGDYASTSDLLFYWRFDNTGDRTENLGSDGTHDLDAENDPGASFIADAPVGV